MVSVTVTTMNVWLKKQRATYFSHDVFVHGSAARGFNMDGVMSPEQLALLSAHLLQSIAGH